MGDEGQARVLIWGTGWNFYASLNNLLLMRELGQVELVAITDREPPEVASIDGVPVLPREEAVRLDYDLVMVMSIQNYAPIREDLVTNWAIPAQKVVSCELLRVPRIDLCAWLKLRDERVSIVSDLPWGGELCGTLQLGCNSPFHDLFVLPDDYLALLEHLEEWVGGCEPTFVEMRFDLHDRRYPVMRLGEANLHFCGSATPEEARERWTRDVSLVNWDNLFVMAHATDPAHAERFERLERFGRRVCFVPFETNLGHCMQLPVRKGDTWLADVVMGTASRSRRSLCIDPVGMLLGRPGWQGTTVRIG